MGTSEPRFFEVETIVDACHSSRTELDATLAEVESSNLVESGFLDHHCAGAENLLLDVCRSTEYKAVKLITDIGRPPVESCQIVVEVNGHGHEWDRYLADRDEFAG